MPGDIQRFALTSSAAIVLILLATWTFGGFDDLSPFGVYTLVVGVVVSVGLGVGLMMLTFYSNRSKRDFTVHRLGHDRRDS
jgi:hypothetical protein